MDLQPQPNTPLSKQEQADAANAQLKVVLQNLKETKKLLARDWAQLSPRERSACARQVKDLERQQEALLKEIELLTIEMNS